MNKPTCTGGGGVPLLLRADSALPLPLRRLWSLPLRCMPCPSPWSLTCAKAQPDAPELPLGELVVVPDRELGARFGHVRGLEAVIDHGVVERGAEALLGNAGLLPA